RRGGHHVPRDHHGEPLVAMHSRSPVLYALAATAGLALLGALAFPGCASEVEVVGPPLVECKINSGFSRDFCPPGFGCGFANCQGFGPEPNPAGPLAHDSRPCYCLPLADAEGCCQPGFFVADAPVDARVMDSGEQLLCMTPAFAARVCSRSPCP